MYGEGANQYSEPPLIWTLLFSQKIIWTVKDSNYKTGEILCLNTVAPSSRKSQVYRDNMDCSRHEGGNVMERMTINQVMNIATVHTLLEACLQIT